MILIRKKWFLKSCSNPDHNIIGKIPVIYFSPNRFYDYHIVDLVIWTQISADFATLILYALFITITSIIVIPYFLPF